VEADPAFAAESGARTTTPRSTLAAG
jgi:hypothetical protein